LQADYALSATHCKLNAVVVSTLSVAPSKAIVEANQAEIKRLCPTDCKVTVVDVNAVDIGTKLSGLMQSTLQRNPDTNMIIHGSDGSYLPNIVAAQTALGTKIPIIGNSGAAIPPQPDVPTIADSITGNNLINGWYFFASVVRVANGEKGFTTEIPTSLVDKTTWGTGKPPFVPAAFNDYQNAFKKLWGVS
jgi:ribose transport system substrate-binding protein